MKFLYYESLKKFHSWKGLVFGLLITVFLSLSIFQLIPETYRSAKILLAIVGLTTSVYLVYWAVYVWHYPKSSKDNVGVVIGVKTESWEDWKLLKDDFVSHLKKRIGDFDLPIDVVVLKKHQAGGIESFADAETVLRKNSISVLSLGEY